MGKVEIHSTEKVYKPCEYPINNFKSLVAQSYATLVQCIFLFSIGMLYVMPTVVVGALYKNKENEKKYLTLDEDSASWIGSILFICHPFGAIASGFLAEKFGRKGAMMVVNIPYVIGWLLLWNATSVQGLYMATLTMGIGIGFCEAPAAAYISEANEPRLRGIFNCMISAACNLGGTIELFISSLFDWQTSAFISAVVPVISFALFLTIPESPVWLITQGRLEEAQKSLGWLRGFLEPQYVQKEFDDLVRYSKLSFTLSHKSANGTLDEKIPLDDEKHVVEEVAEGWFKERYKELKNPKLYLPLRLVFITFFITQCACLAPFRSYFVEILNQFWFPVHSEWVLVMTGVVSFFGSVAAIFMVRITGKRMLSIVCMIITIASNLVLGIFASFFTHTENVVLSWLLITDLAINSFFAGLGVGNLPWILICEIFPVRGRGMATGLSAAWSCFVLFFMSKSYLQTESIIGLSGMFYVYTFISLIGFIYIYVYVPETEGKSLELIETYFTPNHDRKEKFRMPARNSSKV